MIDFGNTLQVLEEEQKQRNSRLNRMNRLFQESKKTDVNGEDVDTAEKYDDKYDLDNDMGTTIEPIEVDIDDDDEKENKKKSSKKNDKDDEDTDTEDEEDSSDDDEDSGEEEEEESDKKGKSKKKKEEEEIDDVEECGDEFVGESFAQWQADHKLKSNYKRQLIQFEKHFIGIVKSLKKNPENPQVIGELTDIYKFIKNARQRYLTNLGNPEHDVVEIEKLDQIVAKLLGMGQITTELIQNMTNLLRLYLKEVDHVKRDKPVKQEPVKEAWIYQESKLKKTNPKQDIDEYKETGRAENTYYSFITNSSKDLEHLYKTLMKRADRETVVEEMTKVFEELKERRENYYKQNEVDPNSLDVKRSYQGLKKVIDQDITNIEQNLEQLRDPKQEKISKSLLKKTVKMINNLQQDMITECQRSQPAVIRHSRELAKKMWLFESYTEENETEQITMEDGEDAMFAKIGEIMVRLRKQKDLQELAEKNGVQVNGIRYTDDTIMNIATSVIALMMAREEGDPRYRKLVEQGMQKRSLKVELINSYKQKANDLINRYDNGPIVGAKPYHDDHDDHIEIVTDDDAIEEFYIDPITGEMKSSWYHESKKEDEDACEDCDDEEVEDEEDSKSKSKKKSKKKKDDDEEKEESEEDELDDEDDEDSEKDDEEDNDEDEDIEEFYIDPITGEMKSSWYHESSDDSKKFDKVKWHVDEGADEDDNDTEDDES